MFIPFNGYSRAQYNRAERTRIVMNIVRYLPRVMEYVHADGVVVTGKSGISMMFAALEHFDVPFMVVRKPGENSHGEMVEGTMQHDFHRYVLLDDMVETGDTVCRVVNTLAAKCISCESTVKPICAGVVTYAGMFGEGWQAFSGMRIVETNEGGVPVFNI